MGAGKAGKAGYAMGHSGGGADEPSWSRGSAGGGGRAGAVWAGGRALYP